MEKFKHEKKFLENLKDKNSELFSINELYDGHGLTPQELFNRPKFMEHFLDGVEYSSSIMYMDAIFVYNDDIYIYLSKNDPIISSFSCKIYYPIRKKKEVEFFMLNLKKLKKNGN